MVLSLVLLNSAFQVPPVMPENGLMSACDSLWCQWMVIVSLLPLWTSTVAPQPNDADAVAGDPPFGPRTVAPQPNEADAGPADTPAAPAMTSADPATAIPSFFMVGWSPCL